MTFLKSMAITVIIASIIVLVGFVLPAMVSSRTDAGPLIAGIMMLGTLVYGIVKLVNVLTKKEKKTDEKVS